MVITQEEMSARPKQPDARKKSTAQVYAATARKGWPKFLNYANWDVNGKANFFDEQFKPRDVILQAAATLHMAIRAGRHDQG